MFLVQNFLVPKKFWSKTYLGPTKILGLKKIFGSKRILSQKFVGGPLGNRVKFDGEGWVDKFLSLRQVYISNLSLLLALEPFKKLAVGGGWWVGGWVVKRHFSVLLWTKASGFGLGLS